MERKRFSKNVFFSFFFESGRLKGKSVRGWWVFSSSQPIGQLRPELRVALSADAVFRSSAALTAGNPISVTRLHV